ncbi:MAG TPA: nitroreductase family protein [Longimicrobiaceae bacterium]|nr:nitroreductase family protein [Longimicrobiaceae bacterium]
MITVHHAPRRPAPSRAVGSAAGPELLRELVRLATLAPSSHNTQPWRFRAEEDRVEVLADFERWLRFADGDRRELYLSVGCALENLLVAAEHFGCAHEVRLFPDPLRYDLVAAVRLGGGGTPSPLRGPGLFDAIPLRHTTRLPFTPDHVSDVSLRRLEECAAEPGVRLVLTRDPALRRSMESLVARADALEFASRAFRSELAEWVGRGAFGARWPWSKVAEAAVRHVDMGPRMARKDAALVAGAPVLGLLGTALDDRESRVRTGQVLERVWLTAASLGLAVQPLSAPLQLPELRAEVAALPGAPAGWPQHVFRLGCAAGPAKHTPRRPLEEVMTTGERKCASAGVRK